MTKREKVIKGLECWTSMAVNCDIKCAYKPDDEREKCVGECDFQRLCKDALELLKEKDINVLTKWISVKDRVPDLDGEYLCWFGDYPMGAHYRICRYTNSKGFYCYTDNFKWHFITHWMPLPEPPKEDET